MKKTKEQKAITLVALVITIIILVILAGISISALTNQGIFGKALSAKNTVEQKEAEENEILKNYLEQINLIEGGQLPETPETPTEDTIDTENTKPSQSMPENATIIEEDYGEGIVIADSKGNEWTWVEVPKSTVFTTATSSTDYNNIKTDLIAYASTYRNSSYTDEWYNGCGILDSETYTTMYNKMLSSVYTNGGFWISRYEIGDSTATANNKTRISNSGTTGIAVSKENQIPYNYVTCSQAQSLASGMSTDENKTSSLLFGIQWDLVCKHLEVNGGWDTTTNLASYYLNTNSTSWGNYSNNSMKLIRGKYLIIGNTTSTWKEYNVDTTKYVTNSQTSNNESYYQLLTTGASEQTNKINIYDFAGNEWEWTLEKISSSIYSYSNRGGAYHNAGYIAPASYRHELQQGSGDYNIGFRVTLY